MNLRDIKKDIDYVLGAFIEDCSVCVAVNPKTNDNQIAGLMEDAIDLYNELRDKVSARKIEGSKKAYFAALRKEILERTDALYAQLSEAVAHPAKEEAAPAEKKSPAKKAPANKEAPKAEKPAEEPAKAPALPKSPQRHRQRRLPPRKLPLRKKPPKLLQRPRSPQRRKPLQRRPQPPRLRSPLPKRRLLPRSPQRRRPLPRRLNKHKAQ